MWGQASLPRESAAQTAAIAQVRDIEGRGGGGVVKMFLVTTCVAEIDSNRAVAKYH